MALHISTVNIKTGIFNFTTMLFHMLEFLMMAFLSTAAT